MPKIAASLSDLQIRRLKDDGVYAIGGVAGLMLRIQKGRKSFFLRYTSPLTQKRREMALGAYGVCSLKQARDKAAELRAQIGDGLDPLQLRAETQQKEREEFLAKTRAAYTVSKLSDEFVSFKDTFSGWSQKDRDLFLGRLGRYIIPILGDQSIGEVTAKKVAEVLLPIWQDHAALSKKIRGMLRQMFAWAKAREYFTGADPVDPKVLQHLLPKRERKVDRHHGMLAVKDVPRFMEALRQREGIAARCLEFAVLTATRSSNARQAQWEEIDWERKLWIIPARKTKVAENGDLVVPLSQQAMVLLKSIGTQGFSSYIFPARHGNSALSDGAFKSLIIKMNAESLQKGEGGFVDPKQKSKNGLPAIATPHGIARASFRTWAQDDELGNDRRFSDKIAEMCLHHKISDAYNGAYERNEAMKSRTEMMQAWADYCFSAK